MESAAAAPSTPENAARSSRHSGVRRVHTLPTKLIDPSRTSPSISPAADSVETLFVHPLAKVVSFAIATARPGSSSARTPDSGSASGTLSWISPSERTLAAGPLKIYRVPSSGVSFLNSGSLLHPILQRSQCWCVDGVSKFVLRVREGSFYRIELPYTSEEDKSKVEEFKIVLDTVLQYERTSSPFRRGYIETPERPQTPVRRSTQPREKAKRWRLNKVWEPEDPEQRAKLPPANRERAGSPSEYLNSRGSLIGTDSDESGRSDESTEDEDTVTDGSVRAEQEEETEPKETKPPQFNDAGSPHTYKLPLRLRPQQPRSMTAPPPLIVETAPPSASASLSRSPSRDTDTTSIASSHDTFYSMEEPAVDTAKATDDQEERIIQQFARVKPSGHKRQVSEVTIVPDTPTPVTAMRETDLTEEGREPSGPSTPTLISDSDDNEDPPFQDAVTPPDTLRLRRLSRSGATLQRPALEPPRTPNFFSTPAAPSRKKMITTALVQRAYSLLIGPPAHLVALMLDIAARIVKGIHYELPITRHKIPGSWDSSADEEDEWDEDDFEDDFGIPLDNLRRASDASAHSSVD